MNNATCAGRKSRVVFRSAALFLLAYSLAGCASPVSLPSKSAPPNEVRRTPVQSGRAIISFQRPTADNRPLFVAISDACRCTPVFSRIFGDSSLIYIIPLPQGRSFADFEKALMQSAPQLGIVSIEQDSVEHF